MIPQSKLAFAGLVTLLLPSLVFAQANPKNQDHAVFLEITIEDGQLAGPGARPFLGRCLESKYVLFGEQHGVAGLAEFVAATQASLPQDNPQALVLEAGDWSLEQLSRQAELGPEQVDGWLRESPYSLAFDFDGDLNLLRQSSRLGVQLIGVDQESTAIHPLRHLAGSARSLRGRRLAQSLYLKSLLQRGEYIRTDHFQDLETLRARLGEDPAGQRIADAIRTSMRIFVDHRADRIQQSVQTREALMKSIFDDAVSAGQSDDRQPIRYLFKMGGAHLMRGVGPNGVETLGEHLAQRAQSGGGSTYHVGIHRYRPESPFPMPAELKQAGYVFLDCQRLRDQWPHLSDPPGQSIPEDLQLALAQFDGYVLLIDADSASQSTIRGYQRLFVRGEVPAFAAFVVPLLLLLPVAWSVFRRWVWKPSPAGFIAAYSGSAAPYSSAAWATILAAMALGQIALLILQPNAATPSSAGLVWFLDTVAWGGAAILLVIGWRQRGTQRWSDHERRVFWLAWLAGLMTAAYNFYWNLGGLLGA